MTDTHDSRAISRREFLAASGATVAALTLPGISPLRGQHSAARAVSGPAARVIPFNTGWLFGEWKDSGVDPDFDDSDFATVTLPHTVTRLSWRNWDPTSWERRWLYRKHFDASIIPPGLRVFLDFDAAMTASAVVVNGVEVGGRNGGYLPFQCEITDVLRTSGENVVAVTLDSRFNIDVPPDRPQPYTSDSVDFWQPGGVYRDVTLRAVPRIYIADVFAKPVDVLDPARRRLIVQVDLDAGVVPAEACELQVTLLDGSRAVSVSRLPVTLVAAGRAAFTVTLTQLSDILLWDVDRPKLYTVRVRLDIGGRPIHEYDTRIGFREARFTLDGFFLNGRRVKLFGVNRHQFFPFAGGAMPWRVQRRDAEIIRWELNCNFVRCSHYPQSEAFLNACDELGLMVWEEIPGWGYFGDTAWQAAAERDVREMILRDRNHPSIIVWGCMPNEAGNHPTQYNAWNALAHALDDSRPTGGDDHGFGRGAAAFEFDVYSHHDYSHHIGPDGHQVPDLKAPVDAANKPYLVCEAVGTLSGPAKYYRRTDPQWIQQGQALAHARVHEIAHSDDRYCGLAAWSGFDYESNKGNVYQGIKFTGVVDLFREPKPGAAIYRAQVDPRIRPVIEPAFYWDFSPTSPANSLSAAMICSNMDRLELFVDGEHFATARPDIANYGHLPYPPFFVDLTSVSGNGSPELRIDGYLGSKKVMSRSFSSDPRTDRLFVTSDDEELIADGDDATRVVFRAVDRYGAPRPYVTGDVTVTISGPAVVIGDNPFSFADAGGVGAVWLRTIPNSPGIVRVRVVHPTLGVGETALRIRPAVPGGRPTPYAELTLGPVPVVAVGGENTTIHLTLTNRGRPSLTDVEVTLEAPSEWRVQTSHATHFASISPDHSVSTSWRVAAPSAAKVGSYPVVARARYRGAGQRGVAVAETPFVIAYPSLAAAFNNSGISDDSNVDEADFDGVGNSYSAEALAAAGFRPGSRIIRDGIAFTWPDVRSGEPDNVLADGQVIVVRGQGSKLGVLGASSSADVTGTGVVYFSDGTSQEFTLTLDNYWYPPSTSDNTVLVALPYVNSQGIGGRPRGQRQHTVYVFFTAVELGSSKPVEAVALPRGGAAQTGRITGMHIFSIGVG